MAYEVRISCKEPFSVALYVYSYFENQFNVFQTAPMVVYILTLKYWVRHSTGVTESLFI